MTKKEMLIEVLGGAIDKYKPIAIGDVLYIKLNKERRVKITLYNTWSSDNYDAVKIGVINKNDGEIDKRIVKFSELFKCMQDLTHPNKIGKHIWYSGGKYEWYGKPTKEDLKAIRETVVNYIELMK